MFKRTSCFLALGLLLAPGASPSYAQAAAAQVNTVRVVAKQAQIRLQPNARSPLIGQAVSGTLLQVVSREGDWYRVVVTPQVRLVPTAPASGFVEARLVQPLPPGDPRSLGKPGAVAGGPAGRQAARAPVPLQLRPRRFGQVAYQQYDASSSFEAIFGSASAPIYGGGIDVLIGRSLFLQGDVTHMRRTGERAFVFEGEVFQLGIEQEVQVTPITFNAGYRFGKNPRLVPYVGGGAGVCLYRERSPGSGADARFSRNGVVYQGLGGFEFRLSRWLAAAAEGRYSYIPGILGEDGVSLELNEKNLGGISGGVKLIIGRM